MRKRKIFVSVLLVMVCLFVIISLVKAKLEANLEKLAVSAISEVDLSKISDGFYSGGYKAFPIAAEVEVEVSNHSIAAVRLKKHNNGQGAPAEAILSKVVEAQSLQVDTIAGATYSSKVILKAIEAALNDSN